MTEWTEKCIIETISWLQELESIGDTFVYAEFL